MTMPQSQNKDWGFYNTILHQDRQAAWEIAIKIVSEATWQPLTAVRAFLDSRFGRHFADEVNNHLAENTDLTKSIYLAKNRWMAWSIGSRTSRDYDIPKGLPYLTGFVIHAEIMEE